MATATLPAGSGGPSSLAATAFPARTYAMVVLARSGHDGWDGHPPARSDDPLQPRIDALRDVGVEVVVVPSAPTASGCGRPPEQLRDVLGRVATAAADRGIGGGLVLVIADADAEGAPSAATTAALRCVPELQRASLLCVDRAGGGEEVIAACLDEQLRRHHELRVPDIDDDPEWVVRLELPAAERRVQESLTTMSNGVVGIRGAREEGGDASRPLLLVAGVFTGRPVPRLLPGPVWPALMVRGEDSLGDRWALDLRTGVLVRSRHDATALRTLRFVSLRHPALLALRAEGGPRRLAGGAALRQPPGDIAYESSREGTVDLATTRSDRGGGIVVATATSEVVADGRRCVERLAAVRGGNNRLPRPAEVTRDLDEAISVGFGRLLAEQREAWAQRWRDAVVKIEGDADAQLAVRFALFHLLASASTEGEAGVGARGLSGEAYAGHVFWDADVFVLPTLAAVQPAAARAMLRYRVTRLPRAMQAASEAGSTGARFPWESADDGGDVTPTSARGRDGKVVPIRTGRLEVHINADIAWAACEYAAWTGDQEFLRTDGAGLVLETARFWASRIRLDGAGVGHLYGVIGPDEYHEPVDDNAFTNVMVRWHLRRAADLAEARGGARPAEAERWRSLAAAMADGYRAETGVYEQFAGFDRLDPLLIGDVATPPVAADLLLGADVVHRSQVIKQPDVLMLHHLVPDETEPGSLLPNLDVYGPRTAHGSSLSPAIQAAVLARAGRVSEALALFRLACRLDLDDLTQTTSGGLHLAAMGGVWQALTYGFLGVRPGARLVVDPILPEEWDRVEVRLRFRGARLVLVADHQALTVTTERPIDLLLGPARATASAGVGTSTFAVERRRA